MVPRKGRRNESFTVSYRKRKMFQIPESQTRKKETHLKKLEKIQKLEQMNPKKETTITKLKQKLKLMFQMKTLIRKLKLAKRQICQMQALTQILKQITLNKGKKETMKAKMKKNLNR